MSAKFKDVSHHLFALLLDVSGATREHCVDESGVLELGWGLTVDQKWSQCLGCIVRHHPLKVISNQYVIYIVYLASL
jgi:hypothetical protein